MPKLKGPLFSVDARGTLGKKIIYTRGGFARNYFKPRNPKSAAQEAHREWFKENYMGAFTKEQADLLYAAILHLHDDHYSPFGHLHDDDYAPSVHDHEDLYSPIGHSHGDVLRVVKTANTARSSTTTYADDPDFVFSLETNSVYSMRAVLVWAGSNTTHDCKVSIRQSNCSIAWSIGSNFDGVGAASTPVGLLVNGGLAVGSGALQFGLMILGKVETFTNPPEVAFQWAQNTSNANPLTLQAGSMMELIKA